MKFTLLAIFLLSSFFTMVEGMAFEERIFLGDLIRSEEGVFIQLDLSPVRRSRKIADEDLAKLFTKISGKERFQDDITIDLPRESLTQMLPPEILEGSLKLTVVLGSEVFTAPAGNFILQNSVGTFPEWSLGLRLEVPDAVKIPESTEHIFVIASLEAELPEPVIYQQSDFSDSAIIEQLDRHVSKGRIMETRRFKEMAIKRKDLTEQDVYYLETFEKFLKQSEEGKFSYFLNQDNKDCLYASYTSGEVAGYSALYKYCLSNKKVQIISPMEFTDVSILGSSGEIIELDIDKDAVNEIFFRVTYYEGGRTVGYRKDPNSPKFLRFLQTDYTGV
ncbi:hypothetical protein L0156_03020 [bacterium]|nr:hypothetical protein [bacterium]